MLNTKYIIGTIHDNQVTTSGELKKLGFKLVPLDSGAYRAVVKIKNSSVVVKFPISESGVNHARAEYNTVQKVLKNKRLEPLRKFMPEIYYFDKTSGVIVMEYYKPVKPNKYGLMISDLLRHIVRLVHPYAKKGHSTDVACSNIGLGKDDWGNYERPVILDLGYFDDLGKGRSGDIY